MNTSLLTFAAVAGVATLCIALTLCLPLLDGTRGAARSPGGRRLAAGAALIMPMLATSLYALLGSPRVLLSEPAASAHRMNSLDMTLATDRLLQKLKASPQDVEGWFVLARSYQAMARWREAAGAYRKAIALAPDDAQLMADLADVLGSAQGGDLEGEPSEWIVQTLRHDPAHPKGRALAAVAAYRANRLDEAMFHWEKLAAGSQPGSEGAELARQGMARIQDARAIAQQATRQPRPGKPTQP